MRRFSLGGFLAVLIGIAMTQLPWLVGLLPFYHLLKLEPPTGSLIWGYGALYLFVLLLVIWAVLMAAGVGYIIFNAVFPEQKEKDGRFS